MQCTNGYVLALSWFSRQATLEKSVCLRVFLFLCACDFVCVFACGVCHIVPDRLS